jgi:hypothetical protein
MDPDTLTILVDPTPAGYSVTTYHGRSWIPAATFSYPSEHFALWRVGLIQREVAARGGKAVFAGVGVDPCPGRFANVVSFTDERGAVRAVDTGNQNTQNKGMTK